MSDGKPDWLGDPYDKPQDGWITDVTERRRMTLSREQRADISSAIRDVGIQRLIGMVIKVKIERSDADDNLS